MHHADLQKNLKIKDWAAEDRPREKLLQKGASALSVYELLAILIGSGTQNQSAVDLAQHILKFYDYSLDALARCSVKDLQKFKGIGQAKAINIVSAIEISRRRNEIPSEKKIKLNDPQAIYRCMLPDLKDKTTEEFWILLLNKSHYLLKKQQISKGGISKTTVDPRIIFKIALAENSSAIVLIHNHPSGNIQPSVSDITLTKTIIQMGQVMYIPVIDHIIFTDYDFFSFRKEKILLF